MFLMSDQYGDRWNPSYLRAMDSLYCNVAPIPTVSFKKSTIMIIPQTTIGLVKLVLHFDIINITSFPFTSYSLH